MQIPHHMLDQHFLLGWIGWSVPRCLATFSNCQLLFHIVQSESCLKTFESHSCFISDKSTTSQLLSHTPLLMQFPPPTHHRGVNTQSHQIFTWSAQAAQLDSQTVGGVWYFSRTLVLLRRTCRLCDYFSAVIFILCSSCFRDWDSRFKVIYEIFDKKICKDFSDHSKTNHFLPSTKIALF